MNKTTLKKIKELQEKKDKLEQKISSVKEKVYEVQSKCKHNIVVVVDYFDNKVYGHVKSCYCIDCKKKIILTMDDEDVETKKRYSEEDSLILTDIKMSTILDNLYLDLINENRDYTNEEITDKLTVSLYKEEKKLKLGVKQ